MTSFVKHITTAFKKLIWIATGRLKAEQDALNQIIARKENDLAEYNANRGIKDLSKTAKIEVPVIKAKEIKEPGEEDFKEWSKFQ